MQNLFQTINYEYRKPANFDANNQEFDVFKNVPSRVCLAPEIKFFSNVRIASNSVIFSYFKVIRESCINDDTYKKYSSGLRFFFKFIFPTGFTQSPAFSVILSSSKLVREHVRLCTLTCSQVWLSKNPSKIRDLRKSCPKFNFRKKRFLLITDEWTNNYYHWHTIALPRLVALREKNLLENSLLILPKKYLRYKFVLPSLEKFGITKNHIVFLGAKSNIKVGELAYAVMPKYSPPALNMLREILPKGIKSELDFGDKIYISRADQVLRFVENEDEIVALLEKFGFKKLLIDKFSYEEQIAICSKVKYLVSPHGAGLTNILFMPRDSAILELMVKSEEENFVTHYYRLANMINIKYFCQECEMGPNSQVKDFHQSSLVVDVKKLEKNLKLMLEHE